MKTIALLALAIILCIAGCTAPSAPGSPVPPAQENVLPMNASTTLGTGNHTTLVSIDSFEISPQADGKQTLTIYVAAKNTGTDPVKYVWFSKLTDLSGTSFGGIGVSHAGNGARSSWILPNNTEAARDYVVVDSAQELAALNKGATLDVYFMEQKANVTPTLIPDYHVTWKVDPGAFTNLSSAEGVRIGT